eukprot:gene22202-biopygen20716
MARAWHGHFLFPFALRFRRAATGAAGAQGETEGWGRAGTRSRRSYPEMWSKWCSGNESDGAVGSQSCRSRTESTDLSCHCTNDKQALACDPQFGDIRQVGSLAGAAHLLHINAVPIHGVKAWPNDPSVSLLFKGRSRRCRSSCPPPAEEKRRRARPARALLPRALLLRALLPRALLPRALLPRALLLRALLLRALLPRALLPRALLPRALLLRALLPGETGRARQHGQADESLSARWSIFLPWQGVARNVGACVCVCPKASSVRTEIPRGAYG